MKRLTFIIALLTSLSFAFPSHAVTEKEMDQARAIATQAYLRYANDGSGYLDAIHPRSMADLEKALKQKEKENIKAFKSIPVPKDYASWDKKKLVEYWSVTAFSSKGLLEKGKIGKTRAKKNLNAMTVAAPAPRQDASKKEEQSPKAQPEAPATPKTPESTPQPASGSSASTAADSVAANVNADPLADPLLSADDEMQITKASDHTWIYVIILCILVAVVVALVVFASNIMKKNADKREDNLQPEIKADHPTSSVEANALREKFAATLTAKNEEISSLSKKVESLLSQNTSLKSNLEGLTAEVAALRTRISEANERIKKYEEAEKTANVQAVKIEKPVATHTVQQQQSHTSVPGVRSIFLGRANAKGIFVRADRTLNPGNSIFRLDTSDGFAGSFRVVSNPTVWEMALLTPVESLAGACVAPDITATDGMSQIVNDSAGTAIFEGGCWKVIRKAKIHFE